MRVVARSRAWSTKKLDFAGITFLNSMLEQSFHKSASREISSGDTHAFFEIAGRRVCGFCRWDHDQGRRREATVGCSLCVRSTVESLGQDLLTLIIVINDDEATDLLADRVGRTNVTDFMHSLGLTHTSIQISDLDWDC